MIADEVEPRRGSIK